MLSPRTLVSVQQLKLLKEKRVMDKMIFYILYQGVDKAVERKKSNGQNDILYPISRSS
jgi:hypothetical protein